MPRLVKNFTFKEMNITQLKELNPEIVEFTIMIQELRDYLKIPLNVNSWKRSITQNKKIGGSSNSAHLNARAVDIKIIASDNTINQWKKICEKHGKIGGVNRYKTYTHFTDYESKFGAKKFVVRDYRKDNIWTYNQY